MRRSFAARRPVAVVAALILGSGLATTACSDDEDGDGTDITQNIEDGAEGAGDEIQEGAQEIEDGAEDVGGDIKDGAEDAADEVEEGAEEAEQDVKQDP